MPELDNNLEEVTFNNVAPEDKEWTAYVKLLNEWTTPDRYLRSIIQYARSGKHFPADMHVDLIGQVIKEREAKAAAKALSVVKMSDSYTFEDGTKFVKVQGTDTGKQLTVDDYISMLGFIEVERETDVIYRLGGKSSHWFTRFEIETIVYALNSLKSQAEPKEQDMKGNHPASIIIPIALWVLVVGTAELIVRGVMGV